VLKVALPTVEGAQYVNNDALCKVCHKSYLEAFEHNVHRKSSCETCHGPASKHLETRGNQPGMIRSFATMKRAEKSETCLQCHEQDGCTPGAQWRTSAHAHQGVNCLDCHTKVHYNVAEGSPPTEPDYALLKQLEEWTQLVAERTSETIEKNELVEARQDLPSLRGTTQALGAVAPEICYGCHDRTYDLQAIAHPHQVAGPHAFNCTSCHDPHGNILASSKKDLCLQCHQSTPTTGWHSTIHDQVGVNCVDCHDPHPETDVQKLVRIEHTAVQRPKRLPMSVDDPNVCYKCHTNIFGLTQLPSHHPIREGKMDCSDCHDPHGQADGHLKGDNVNMVCYRCHADKQGPFVHQHAPVEEDCTICHNPHGSVTNNMLHQPTTFLCLRCHSGHQADPTQHFGMGSSDINGLPFQRPVLYTDCTQCHQQVHGSDLPSQRRASTLMR
jgi:DmsE family decaheme c-type cytochrome